MVISEKEVKKALGTIGSRSFDDPDVQKAAADVIERKTTTSRRKPGEVTPTEEFVRVTKPRSTVVTEVDTKTGKEVTRTVTTPEKKVKVVREPGKKEVRTVLTPEPEKPKIPIKAREQIRTIQQEQRLGTQPKQERSPFAPPLSIKEAKDIPSPIERFGIGFKGGLLLQKDVAQRARSDFGDPIERAGFVIGIPAGEVLGEVLGSALASKKVTVGATRQIAGVSDVKGFGAAEGVLQVKPVIGKAKEVPFKAKEIVDIVGIDDALFTAGERTIKVGGEEISSAVRGTFRATPEGAEGLTVVKGADDFFGEFTEIRKFDDGFISRTSKLEAKELKRVKDTPLFGDLDVVGIKEVERTVAAGRKVGTIGEFDISEVGALTKQADGLDRIRVRELPDSGANFIKRASDLAGDTSSPRVQEALEQSLKGIDLSSVQDVARQVKVTERVAVPSAKVVGSIFRGTGQPELVPELQQQRVQPLVNIQSPDVGVDQRQRGKQAFDLSNVAKLSQIPDELVRQVPDVTNIQSPLDLARQDTSSVADLQLGLDLQQPGRSARGVPGTGFFSQPPLPPLVPGFRLDFNFGDDSSKRSKVKRSPGRRTRDLLSSAFGGADFKPDVDKRLLKELEKTGFGFRF